MLHVIFNPVAGKRTARKALRAVERAFAERGVAYTLHETCAVHDGEAIARRLTENGAQDIIVLGGDGTLHEVLNGLCDPSACRLGLIPAGTGNDFAEALGLPLQAERALARILDGEARPVDYIEVGGRRCMNVCGIGMDVDVLERCLRGKIKGKIKYLASLVRSLFAFKGCRVRLETDGEAQEHDVLLCAACNGTQFGGGVRICPAAETDDGFLDVVTVECIGGKMKIIKAFLQLLRGRILQYPATTHFRCKRVCFFPEKPRTIQLDGELYTDLDFTAEIKSGLRFYR